MPQCIQKARQRLAQTDPMYLSLFLALGLIALLICFEGLSYYYLNNYSLIPVMLFWGIVFTRKHRPDTIRQLSAGFLVALWFVISQSVQFAREMNIRSPGICFLPYLFAFPFASAARDEEKQLGLKMAGVAYIGSALVLAFYTLLLTLDALPGFLEPHIFWDGARLMPLWHPNIFACIMMIAIAFCLYFFSITKKWVFKCLLIAVIVLDLFLVALTNSRTGTLLSVCLVAGYGFFRLWKSGWKRFVLTAVIAVLIIAVLFACLQGVFTLHSEQKLQALLSSENTPSDALVVDGNTGEVKLNTGSKQGSLAKDMITLNSRTRIWQTAIAAIKDNPSVLAVGTDSTMHLILEHCGFSVLHSHNAWLESVLNMGIPGLLSALFFTAVAVWNIFGVLFFRSCGIEKKVFALLLACLLIAGILEPYLFVVDIGYLYTNFAFFLCLGYLTQWKRSE